MIGIGRDSIADHFRQSDGPALGGAFLRLQNQKSGAFPQNQAGSILIKRTDFFRRRSLERIEADKNQLAQRLVASTDDTST